MFLMTSAMPWIIRNTNPNISAVLIGYRGSPPASGDPSRASQDNLTEGQLYLIPM